MVAVVTLDPDGTGPAVSLSLVTDDVAPDREPEAVPEAVSPPDAVTIARRRLLVALGFGAANVAVLRHLAVTADESAAVTTSTSGTPTATTTAPSGPRVSTDPVPVLDPSVQVVDPNHVFDVVMSGGRVMDPETGYDSLATVGIDGTKITAIVPGEQALRSGRDAIDATGLVVSPGFIDILSYSPNGYGEWFKVADGVTTNLGMHGLDDRASSWFAARPDNSFPVHFGGAYDNATVRPAFGLLPFDETSDDAAHEHRRRRRARPDRRLHRAPHAAGVHAGREPAPKSVLTRCWPPATTFPSVSTPASPTTRRRARISKRSTSWSQWRATPAPTSMSSTSTRPAGRESCPRPSTGSRPASTRASG